jgi:hypothetical protein
MITASIFPYRSGKNEIANGPAKDKVTFFGHGHGATGCGTLIRPTRTMSDGSGMLMETQDRTVSVNPACCNYAWTCLGKARPEEHGYPVMWSMHRCAAIVHYVSQLHYRGTAGIFNDQRRRTTRSRLMISNWTSDSQLIVFPLVSGDGYPMGMSGPVTPSIPICAS